MDLSDAELRALKQKLLLARMRLLCNNGFFGMLLMHLGFSLSDELDTAATDGMRIYFSPVFLRELSVTETSFVLLHEIMHVALKHCFRGEGRQHILYNIACDIVVNSNILQESGMDLSSISIAGRASMHLTPDGREGFSFTAEEVYEMLLKKADASSLKGDWDDHSRWGVDIGGGSEDEWDMRIERALGVYAKNPQLYGDLPAELERKLNDLVSPRQDWRTVLNEFIQKDVNDYSFFPPDRRFEDTGFYLPDYNEPDEHAEGILFMVDASGSVSKEALTAFYSEIGGAIGQFSGKLSGWVGFFDAKVYEPKPFASEADFLAITPKGGGGTSFKAVFSYIRDKMQDKDISCIVILTDGMAEFPEESAAMGIPVLWLLDNDVITPPWGKTAIIGR